MRVHLGKGSTKTSLSFIDTTTAAAMAHANVAMKTDPNTVQGANFDRPSLCTEMYTKVSGYAGNSVRWGNQTKEKEPWVSFSD